MHWLSGLAIVMLLAMACGQATPGATPAPQGESEVKAREAAKGAECEPGKESWRSPGPPKRGGTLVMAIFAADRDHLDRTIAGRGRPPTQVNQGLVEARGCH